MRSSAPHRPCGAQCVLEFPLACGITVGTPVRIRGVPVGSVLAVHPSLERVEVLAEVRHGVPTACTLKLPLKHAALTSAVMSCRISHDQMHHQCTNRLHTCVEFPA